MKIPSFAMTLLAVVLVFYLLIVGEALLLPLVIAIAIWYLINTLAAMFGRLHLSERELPRSICLGLSFLTFALFIPHYRVSPNTSSDYSYHFSHERKISFYLYVFS